MVDFRYKVCVVGDNCVGKTQIVNRLLLGKFEDKYISTLGVEVSPLVFGPEYKWTDSHNVEFDVWDISRLKFKTDYFVGCQHFVICYDSTNFQSQKNANTYWTQLIRKYTMNPKIIYVATKCNLEKNPDVDIGVDIEISAKDKYNLDTIFSELIRE